MKYSPIYAVISSAVVLAAVSGIAVAQQDRSTLKVPDGLSFSEFKGYEKWEPVSTSQTDKLIKIISGNPTMMKAYRSGLPANGKAFPEGSTALKLEWTRKLDPNAPGQVYIPDQLHHVQFMVKDTKRFPKNPGGWAYALFEIDPATNTLKPLGTGTTCGSACHTRVAAQDYVFTSYPPR